MLFQDNCGGLEVERKGKEGEFVGVETRRGACVVNVGDLLMRWSNGKIISPYLPSLSSFFPNRGKRLTRGRLFKIYNASRNSTSSFRPLHRHGTNDASPVFNPLFRKPGYRRRDRMFEGMR